MSVKMVKNNTKNNKKKKKEEEYNNYAFFFLYQNEYEDDKGDVLLYELDFSDVFQPLAKNKEGKAVKVKDFKQLRKQIATDSKLKGQTPVKRLRYGKGATKKGKKVGGQFMTVEMSQAIRNKSREKGLSIKDATLKYQNKKMVSKVRGLKTIGQHDWKKKMNTKKYQNDKLVVKVKNAQGKSFTFKGTGKDVLKTEKFIKLMDNSLNRVYSTIQKKGKRKKK